MQVRKQNSNAFLALKEIRCNHPGLGHTHSERSSSIGRILNEVNIIHEQLQHPNVVKYHKCFQEGKNTIASVCVLCESCDYQVTICIL